MAGREDVSALFGGARYVSSSFSPFYFVHWHRYKENAKLVAFCGPWVDVLVFLPILDTVFVAMGEGFLCLHGHPNNLLMCCV